MIPCSSLFIFLQRYSVLLFFVSIYIIATAILLLLLFNASMNSCFPVLYASLMRLFNKLQEIYLGGVSEDDLTILRKIAEADDRANLKQICKSRNMTQGTRIIKEWKGKIYTVTITADGRYEYEGENYRSLSAVADKITGTHWNGKKFFGVNKYGRANHKKTMRHLYAKKHGRKFII